MSDHFIHMPACNECFKKFEERLCISAGCSIDIDKVYETAKQLAAHSAQTALALSFTSLEILAIKKELDRTKKELSDTRMRLSDELWSK